MSAEKHYVPSLFRSGVWEVPLGPKATWDEVFKRWERDDLLTGTPPDGQKVNSGEEKQLGEDWANRFPVPLTRSLAPYERTASRNIGTLQHFDPWEHLRVGHIPSHKWQKILGAGVFEVTGQVWLQLRPGAKWMRAADRMPILQPRGVAPVLMGPKKDVKPFEDWQAEPFAFFHVLQKTSQPHQPWYVLARTSFTLREDTQAQGHLVAHPELAFEPLNDAIRDVRGTLHAGSPFQGLVPWFQALEPFDPLSLTVLVDRSEGGERAFGLRLLRIDLSKQAIGKKVQANIDWFSPTREPEGSAVVTGFAISGKLQPAEENPTRTHFQHGWSSDAGILARTFDAMLQSARCGDLVAFELHDCELVPATKSEAERWLRLGSVEILPVGTSDGKGSVPATRLSFSASGQVGTASTSLFPVCRLDNVRCRVRYAAGEDSAPEWAVLDGKDQDAVRESAPIVYRLERKPAGDAEAGYLDGLLTIETRFERGQNATTEIRIEVTNPAPGKPSSAVWLNLRPFMTALVDFPDSRNVTTTLLWRSDDPQGGQWRVEDSTVTVVLPPQAVVEEMERGDRFYDQPDAPDIKASGPVKYRFSPPAYLTLRPSPSEEDRRFERSPVNFRSLMRSSHVERLAFEMAYPLNVVYQRSETSRRQLMLTEAGEFFGTPTERFAPGEGRELPRPLSRFLARLTQDEQSEYGIAVDALMSAQGRVQVNFVSRLAELHVVDPVRPREDLALSEDLSIRLRDYALDKVPLANPLPNGAPMELCNPSTALRAFLKDGGWATDTDGAVRGGLIHSFEMPSELKEVLETPAAVAGVIEALTLSALGATGRMEASFANGKTSFAVVAAHGQLSRLVKTRIGRIGALWNMAKHVVVYERTTARSAQFEDEQKKTDAFDGWPLLRKTEEYVEPVQIERNFYEEAQKDINATGFLRASVFASQRIYVNSAWARDLGDGYELPLWDRGAAEKNSKFYPRPKIFLDCFGEEGRATKLWFRDPDRLFFYTSTAAEARADTDAWPARTGVDFDNLPRWGITEVSTGRLEQRRPASRELCTSVRFDLAVEAEGPVNLQHGRGKTPMLVTLDRVTVSRSSQSSPVNVLEEAKKYAPLAQALKTAQVTAKVQQFAADLLPGIRDLQAQLRGLIAKQMDFGKDRPCSDIAQELIAAINQAHARLLIQLDPLDGVDLPKLLLRERAAWKAHFTEMTGQLLARAVLPEAVLEARIASMRESIQAARTVVATSPNDWSGKLQRELRAVVSELRSVAVECESRARDYLVEPVSSLQTTLDEVAAAAKSAASEFSTEPGDLSARCDKALAHLTGALARAEKLPPQFRKPLEPLLNWLRYAGKQLEALAKAFDVVGSAAPKLAAELSEALNGVNEGLQALAATLALRVGSAVRAVASELETALTRDVIRPLNAKAEALLEAIKKEDIPLVLSALDAADTLLGTGAVALRKLHSDLVQRAQTGLDAMVETVLVALCDALSPPLDELSKRVQLLSERVKALADIVRDLLKKAVQDGEQQCEQVLERLQKELAAAEAWARRQAENTLADVLSSEAGQQIERYTETASTVYDVGSKALSLARAVGDLPRVTPLQFDIDVAAYVFDGTQPQITMTPAVAQLMRQGEEVLEAVGLKVPCQALLDKLIPDFPAAGDVPFKFAEVFRKFGGIDFTGLFKKFELPRLTSQNIRVTHGFEKATRRAWVDTTIAFSEPSFKELFEWGPIALGLERMVLDAYSGVETRLADTTVQQPASKTHAGLLADWILMGGRQRLVTFKRVALKYDGASGFDFDLRPDNVELHPSLKFISEFIARFKENIPPAIQIEEENGRPVGVSAGSTIVIDDLPDLGAVSIGPIDMRSSLALRLERHRGLAIRSAFSLGNKQAPIFVQISWLGGGCWLEARADYLEGKVTPSVSVGLALGAMRAFNLAGVAQGSFSVLLYCYIEIRASADIAIGMSITGSALIVGFVNANVNLLLEANHSQGRTEGTGRLDVKVKISWCYTFRFKRTVKHKF